MRARARLGSAVLVAALSSGCATATGSDWVREPEGGLYQTASAPPALGESAGGFDLGSAPPTETAPGGRQRLRETVTLGETAAEAARAPRPDAPVREPAAPTVVIHQYFDGGSSDFAASSFVPAGSADGRRFTPRAMKPRVVRSSAMPPTGGSWPAPPSYGPPFPYKTAPASPWQGER